MIFGRGGSVMVEYEGPSFFKHAKRQSSDPSTDRLKENLHFFKSTDQQPTGDRELFSERSSHTLPDHIIKRDEIEKGFQDYLEEKSTYNPPRSKHYVEPPFEASRVPSPIFGYKKPLKKDNEDWDYGLLKEKLKKEHFEFLMFEEFETPELTEYWEMQLDDEKKLSPKNKNTNSLSTSKEATLAQTKVPFKTEMKKETQNSRNKRMKLQRSLMNIINEEQLGKNKFKSNLPGFFSDENE